MQRLTHLVIYLNFSRDTQKLYCKYKTFLEYFFTSQATKIRCCKKTTFNPSPVDNLLAFLERNKKMGKRSFYLTYQKQNIILSPKDH